MDMSDLTAATFRAAYSQTILFGYVQLVLAASYSSPVATSAASPHANKTLDPGSGREVQAPAVASAVAGWVKLRPLSWVGSQGLGLHGD
jgi:hypothetical protein